jgi:hypothetical protein
MKSARQFALLFAALAFASGSLYAQHVAGPAVAMPVASSPHYVAHSSISARSATRPTPPHVNINGVPAFVGPVPSPRNITPPHVSQIAPGVFLTNGLTLDQILGNGVPGLGFDYAHLAAISGNLGVEALINPVTEADLALAERLGQFRGGATGGFFPFLGGGGIAPEIIEQPAQDTQSAQQQQPIIIVQQPASSTVATAPEQTPDAAAPAAINSVAPDPSEFILVKKDGEQVLAGGYSLQKDRIVYVTKEGAKRIMLLSELDKDATELINQERGTSVSF